MALARLSLLTSRLTATTVSQGILSRQPTCSIQSKSGSQTVSQNNDDDDNTPIQYTTSPAAQWQAKYSQQGGIDNSPWFQPLVVGTSTAIFIIYFLYLREANDIDAIFDKELGDHFPNQEIEKLKKSINEEGMNIPKKN